MYYVYIIKWNKYYVWYTNNIERRLKEHERWENYYTNRIWNKILVWYIECESKELAIDLERKIKKSKNIKRRILNDEFIKYTGV